MLTEQTIIRCLAKAGCLGTVKLSFESGPYEIDRTTVKADALAEAIEAEVRKEQAEKIAELERQLAWIEQKLFVSRWNGVIDSGSKTTWQIAPEWRHTVTKIVGNTFGEAIDAARKDQP